MTKHPQCVSFLFPIEHLVLTGYSPVGFTWADGMRSHVCPIEILEAGIALSIEPGGVGGMRHCVVACTRWR